MSQTSREKRKSRTAILPFCFYSFVLYLLYALLFVDFVLFQLNHIQNAAIQGSADTNQRFHADVLSLSHVGNHICGKTGGKTQVLFPHIALNQRVPAWPNCCQICNNSAMPFII